MAKKAPVKAASVKKSPVTVAPVKKASVKQAPAKEASVKKTSVTEAPAKEATAKKAEPQAKPAKPQIPARLLAAVRTVLEDADDTGRENSVVVGATSYNALRTVFYDLTGQWWGMEVEELDEDENEEMDEEDDEDYDDE